jgi:hypothetical protein
VTYQAWVAEVEAAVGSEERLIELDAQVVAAPGLSDDQREEVRGRIDRYRDNHEDMRGDMLVAQAEAALAGQMRDDAIPDFDLTFDQVGAVEEEPETEPG